MTRVDRLSSRITSAVLLTGLIVFLFAPLLVVAGASLGSAETPYVSFPPKAISLHWYASVSGELLQSVIISLALALGTAISAAIIAIPAALGLVRARFKGKQVISLLLRAPLQIPFVVTGIAFLQVYYLVDGWSGIQLRGSYLGLLLGHLFLATPYAIGAIVAVLTRFNPRVEEAAASLGANPWRVLVRVTLPIIRPGIIAGSLYAFIVSFGEVPVALFLGGPERTTFPVELFTSMQFDFSPVLLAISTAMLGISFIVLIAVQRLIGFDALMRTGSVR